MSDIPAPDLAHHVESEVVLSTMPGGTPIPFHVERFGGTSHIAPSIPVVEQLHMFILDLVLVILCGYQN